MTNIERRLHNPLLMFRGINTPSEVIAKTPECDEFLRQFEAAKTQTNQKNLTFGLELDESDNDLGCGGFHNSGILPMTIMPYYARVDGVIKDLDFYWPRRTDGKLMAHIASVNLGLWPIVFHELTKWEVDKWWTPSCVMPSKRADRFMLEQHPDVWIHLFASSPGDFETFAPDCHVRMNFIDPSKYDDLFSEEKIALVQQWIADKEIKSEINTGKIFFQQPKLRFFYDGGGSPKQMEEDEPAGIFAYDRGVASVYGIPATQQEPRRFISPSSYGFKRACTPMFSFTDQDHDMTHQFYVDACMMDEISHKRAYCKLDSSCT